MRCDRAPHTGRTRTGPLACALCLLVCSVTAPAQDEPGNGAPAPETTRQEAPGALSADAEGTLTLQQAKRIALRDNPGIAAAQARVQQAQAIYRQAKAPYYPSLTLSAAVVHNEDIPADSAGGFESDSVRIYSTEATARWLVFDGFTRRFNLLAAEYGRSESREAYRDAQRVLLEAVAIAFYQALLARENMRIARQDADFNETLSKETQKRFDAGAAARSDVLNFQIRTAQAESSYLVSATDYTNANIVLAVLLGIPSAQLPAEMTPATQNDDPLEVPLPQLDREVAYALEHRPDYMRIEHTTARLEANAEAVRGDYWPAVGLEAAYGWSRADNPRFNDSRDAGSYIGISATWDIFTGGSTAAAYSAARAQVLENRRRREALHNDIVAEIARQIEATKLAKQQVELQRRIHKMTSEARELVRNEYAAGRTSLTRLNEAQTDLIRAAGNLAVATIRYWQVRETLAAGSGRILDIEE